MPLRCLDDADRSLDASLLTTPEWTALTATNRHVRHLRTTCCGAPLVLKTSRLGTRFFAHLALGGCSSGDEGPEHLHLKAMSVAAARADGWTAEAEVSGATPAGEPWRADVLATKGRHRIAIEVQWSPQADDVTRARQARYAASGVRGLWLFRQAVTADADVPAVRVRGSLTTGLTILGLSAADFLAAVFDRRLRFGFPVGTTAEAIVAGSVARCWGADCGALVRVVTAVDLTAGGSRCHLPVGDLGATPALLAVTSGLPADPLRGRLRMGRDGSVAARCFACDRPLTPRPGSVGRFVVARVALTVTPVLVAEIVAAPGYAPAWGITTVASARANA